MMNDAIRWNRSLMGCVGVCGKGMMPLVCASISVRDSRNTDHSGGWEGGGAFVNMSTCTSITVECV